MRWHIRVLPEAARHFWVPIRPQKAPLSGRRLTTWPYVLQALRLPCRLYLGSRPLLLVPVFLSGICLQNLLEFDEEERHPRPEPSFPADHPSAWLTCLLILPLLFLQALRFWAPMAPLASALGFPAQAEDWLSLFACDNVRMRLFHEWARAGTALFLHADAAHLAANAGFTLVFASLLGKRTGSGLALLLIIWTGTLANVLAALVRPYFVLSIGFSTALFAGVGCLSGFMACCSRPKALLPLAAGLAILALLGTEGDNTDYLSHTAGLLAGMMTGFLAAVFSQRMPAARSAAWQAAFFLLGLALPVLCFVLRLKGIC